MSPTASSPSPMRDCPAFIVRQASCSSPTSPTSPSSLTKEEKETSFFGSVKKEESASSSPPCPRSTAVSNGRTPVGDAASPQRRSGKRVTGGKSSRRGRRWGGGAALMLPPRGAALAPPPGAPSWALPPAGRLARAPKPPPPSVVPFSNLEKRLGAALVAFLVAFRALAVAVAASGAGLGRDAAFGGAGGRAVSDFHRVAAVCFTLFLCVPRSLRSASDSRADSAMPAPRFQAVKRQRVGGFNPPSQARRRRPGFSAGRRRFAGLRGRGLHRRRVGTAVARVSVRWLRRNSSRIFRIFAADTDTAPLYPRPRAAAPPFARPPGMRAAGRLVSTSLRSQAARSALCVSPRPPSVSLRPRRAYRPPRARRPALCNRGGGLRLLRRRAVCAPRPLLPRRRKHRAFFSPPPGHPLARHSRRVGRARRAAGALFGRRVERVGVGSGGDVPRHRNLRRVHPLPAGRVLRARGRACAGEGGGAERAAGGVEPVEQLRER